MGLPFPFVYFVFSLFNTVWFQFGLSLDKFPFGYLCMQYVAITHWKYFRENRANTWMAFVGLILSGFRQPSAYVSWTWPTAWNKESKQTWKSKNVFKFLIICWEIDRIEYTIVARNAYSNDEYLAFQAGRHRFDMVDNCWFDPFEPLFRISMLKSSLEIGH